MEKTATLRAQAEAGCAKAQHDLALNYLTGSGVNKNPLEGLAWLKKAARQNLRAAQHNMGVIYSNNYGIPNRPARAAVWFRKAARQGLVVAMVNLGYLYYFWEKDLENSPLTPDPWFARAQKRGAILPPHLEPNYKQAFYWFNRAAEASQPDTPNFVLTEAQFYVGYMYMYGLGCVRNKSLGESWLRKAAALGHKDAQNQLNLSTSFEQQLNTIKLTYA